MEKYPQFKMKLANARNVVNNQVTKLRILETRFISIDKDLSKQVILHIKNGDNSRAKALASELSNIRKIKNTTQNLLMSLEIVIIRFSTISEFAEVLDTINPMIDTINEVKEDIICTVPAATSMISEFSILTSDVMLQANLNLKADNISIPVNSDALEILNEVQNVMEEDAKSNLPDVPTSLTHTRAYTKGEIVTTNSKVLLEA